MLDSLDRHGSPSILHRVLEASQLLHRGLDLESLLRQTTRQVTNLGFRRALIAVRDGEGQRFRPQAVVGVSNEERQALLNSSFPWSEIEAMLQERFRVGPAYFIPHGTLNWDEVFSGQVIYPDIGDAAGPDAWHPEDALIVPLYDHQGDPIGMLSVDEPIDGRVPSKETMRALGFFANQAAAALENARLYNIAQRELAERRAVERELRQSEREKDAILNSVDQLLVLQDLDHRIIWANRAAAQSKGTQVEKLVGKRCYQVWAARDEPCPNCPCEEVLQTSQSAQREMSTPDGRCRLVAGYPIRDDQGQIVNLIESTLDITERKRLQTQMLRSQKMEAVGLLAGGIAHEFNNLLTSIIGYADMILTSTQEEDIVQKAEDILVSSQQGAELTRQLLAYSQQQHPRQARINLNDRLQDMAETLQASLGSEITLVLELAPKLNDTLVGRAQLEDAIVHMTNNARDAMPQGGTLTFCTRNVTLSESLPGACDPIPPGDYVQLVVADTGCGMTDAVLQRVFEPFFTTKGRAEGTGMALAAIHGMMSNIDGQICVHSAPNQGTRFEFYFPCATTEAETVVPTVLVIDDDRAVRDLIRSILQRQNYVVFSAADGDAAREICAQDGERIDLVLVDVSLPHSEGPDLMASLRKRHSHLQALYMSGYAEIVLRQDGLLDSEAEVIVKPFSIDELVQAVSEALG